jgi:hypothetical protein
VIIDSGPNSTRSIAGCPHSEPGSTSTSLRLDAGRLSVPRKPRADGDGTLRSEFPLGCLHHIGAGLLGQHEPASLAPSILGNVGFLSSAGVGLVIKPFQHADMQHASLLFPTSLA